MSERDDFLNNSNDLKEREEKQKKEEMEKTLQMDYIHQEPWILNAESAIYTDICL